MAKLRQAPQLLLVILVALVSLVSQYARKTFMTVEEVPAVALYVEDTLQFVTNEYNKDSSDEYNFRIVRVLKIEKRVTDHLEYHIHLEMQRTTCRRLQVQTVNCAFQEGELYKQIKCFFSVFAAPWFERYKILSKNCSDG
ncbi:cystatin-11 [Tupaia chinensis]|uniref:cystatin-11 n=1 Tax=Tupaia chinensis TaxID=246437 RepID=UPI0003C8D185|nr:cystatin-11 [Tupaia chinensis]